MSYLKLHLDIYELIFLESKSFLFLLTSCFLS